METSKDVTDTVLDNLVPLDAWARPMFGSYGLYCDGKFVGIISGGHLHIKRSDAAPYLFEHTEPAPPFPGARDWHRVLPHLLADSEWLKDVISETVAALPVPKPKPPRNRLVAPD